MDFKRIFSEGADGKDFVDSLFGKLKSHLENLRGKFAKCHSWCAERQWFGREGWRWTVVKWLCYLGIGVLSVPSIALGVVCIVVLLAGLAGAVAAALGLAVALLSLLLVLLPLYVMAYLVDFGIFSLTSLVLGKVLCDKVSASEPSKGDKSSSEPSDESSKGEESSKGDEPSSGQSSSVRTLVVPVIEEPSDSPMKEPLSSESSSSKPSSDEPSSDGDGFSSEV